MSVVLAIAALAAALSSAPAKGGGTEVIKNGSCSGSANVEAEGEDRQRPDRNRVRGRPERSRARSGDVVIRQNGVKRFERFSEVTKAPSGSFTVRRMLDNKAGQRPDRRQGDEAHATGQVCRGRAHDLEPDRLPGQPTRHERGQRPMPAGRRPAPLVTVGPAACEEPEKLRGLGSRLRRTTEGAPQLGCRRSSPVHRR